jgi:hypothetical protein
MRVTRYSKEWAALRDAGYVETFVRGDIAYMARRR